ncbi:MAG: hypothetical protein AYK23_04545 [Candidatus Proteinoplasmatales archaeon SG8-5]|nr:MAG: hypothetical protein AYK23_04545 [Candidatus Proteinoplasmatales archaeon SG8-5]
MPRDLYEDLSKIEDRGRRLKASNDRPAPKPASSDNKPAPRPPLVLSASKAAMATTVTEGVPGGDNGGPVKKEPYAKRDIYADLESIEERGKRTKDKRSFLGRRKE